MNEHTYFLNLLSQKKRKVTLRLILPGGGKRRSCRRKREKKLDRGGLRASTLGVGKRKKKGYGSRLFLVPGSGKKKERGGKG